MSDKYRIVLSKEDFSPDECELIKEMAGYDPDCADPKAELDRCLGDYLAFQKLYVCAARKLRTNLENLEMDYRVQYDHRVIRSIDSRIKSVKSTYGKLVRRNLPLTIESAKSNLTDIAGIRVLCAYIRDIYEIRRRLLAQDNIKLMRCSDYIRYPKPSGYRSLHLIISVTLHLPDQTVTVPAEIQLRTVAMDSWAALEHKLKYKNPRGVSNEVAAQLRECADVIARTDEQMQRIYESLFVDAP